MRRRDENTDAHLNNQDDPWTAVPNRLLKDARLSRSARLLSCVLLMFADDSGAAFPSQRRLARALGRMAANGADARPASLRSVQRWLHELRAAGWLTWRRSSSGGNVYTLATAHDAADAPPAAGDTPRRVNLGEAWTAVPNRLLTDARLTRGARLLSCLLFMHADKSGQASPSKRRLARLAGWRRAPADAGDDAEARPTTLSSVQRWLLELHAAGWLTWQFTGRTNLYTLTTPFVSRLRAPRMRRGRRRRRYRRRRGSPPSSSPGSAAGRRPLVPSHSGACGRRAQPTFGTQPRSRRRTIRTAPGNHAGAPDCASRLTNSLVRASIKQRLGDRTEVRCARLQAVDSAEVGGRKEQASAAKGLLTQTTLASSCAGFRPHTKKPKNLAYEL